MQTKVIKQKMKSVQSIGKITKAMEMISVSKMRRSIEKRNSSRVFAERSFELLENLQHHRQVTHPYLETREGNKVLVVIIASNKGLCGGYNINVSKQLGLFKKENPHYDIEAIVIGKQAERIAGRFRIPVLASFTELSDYLSAGEVRALLHSITTHFDTGEYAQVFIAYTEFVSPLVFHAKMVPFLPLSVERDEASTSEDVQKKLSTYTFEPDDQEVLDTVVPAVLVTILYQHLLESLASEHSSRVVAMRNAGDNAGEMYKELVLHYNSARQAAITQEIAEIVGGSSALSA